MKRIFLDKTRALYQMANRMNGGYLVNELGAYVNVMISGKKNLPRRLTKLLKGRSGIEPIIGHMKNDHRLSRNYLLGKTGDKIIIAWG